MSHQPIRIDADGLPILEDIVSPADIQDPPPEQMRMPDHYPLSDPLIESLTRDLQKLVEWKIESVLNEEVGSLIRDAARRSAPKLTQDIQTHLQLALPHLLKKLAKKSGR